MILEECKQLSTLLYWLYDLWIVINIDSKTIMNWAANCRITCGSSSHPADSWGLKCNAFVLVKWFTIYKY